MSLTVNASILAGALRSPFEGRATPYLYSESDIAALIAAAGTLRTPHQVATFRTLIALLAVTGMRVGEAIGLDRDDFDSVSGLLTIRNAKFGKSRELPLHPSTVAALDNYLRRDDRPTNSSNTPALLVTTVGTRFHYMGVQPVFRQIVDRAGLKPRSASCRPRLHDLRHNSGNRIIPATDRQQLYFLENRGVAGTRLAE